jgi:NADH dehydrogenase
MAGMTDSFAGSTADSAEGSVAGQRAQRPLRVVVVGAGFGGLAAAQELTSNDADHPVELTVIDQRNHHTFQPLLYQVATAGLGVDDICYATRGIFHRRANTNVMQARVVGIDLDRRELLIDRGPNVGYDRLILALGAVTADYGVPGVADHAFGLKSAAEAIAIRTQVLQRFEFAARTTDIATRSAAMTIVVVGGGPTGVEMAGGFAELIAKPLRKDFPRLDMAEAKVVLVEGTDRLLGAFAPRLGEEAHRRLTERGVEVKLNTQVAKVDPDCVSFGNGESLPTNTVVWAAGVAAHPAASAWRLPLGRGGRVIVDEHLRLADHPEVFVIGDLALPPEGSFADGGGVVPQVAPGAIQGGQHAAALIHHELSGGTTQGFASFRYRDKGSMATIGRSDAVVQMPQGLKITGFLGWAAWLGLHLVMLIGVRNRANVLVNWAWNYLTYDRGSRLIIRPD